jgi:Skp family chaperone for outer membrane proteins
MLLRICLILTIVAGLATAYVGFFPVQKIIVDTRAERDDFHTKLDAETALYQKTDKELRRTKDDLAQTKSKLTETQGELDAANTKNTELDKQNTDLTDKLTKMTARAEADDQKLEQWRDLPPPEQIKTIISDLAQTKKARDVLVAENKLLVVSRDDYKEKWEKIFGEDAPVLLPTGLKGKILAVDPKYDFVVLNIGDDQGVKERGEMMVDRQGKLIGKIRISRVEKDRCVATILPAWKRGQIMEGDQVIY